MNPHTPKWIPTLGIRVLVDFQIFREQLKVLNPLDWECFYIIEKLLEFRRLKWVRMTHLDT